MPSVPLVQFMLPMRFGAPDSRDDLDAQSVLYERGGHGAPEAQDTCEAHDAPGARPYS